MGSYFLKKKCSYIRVFVFHLFPHIKSAYQIRSYVRMDIKREMYLNLNIGIYIAVGVIT